MWKVWFQILDLDGNVVWEGVLLKEYKTKANAAKLAKKFAADMENINAVPSVEYPFGK